MGRMEKGESNGKEAGWKSTLELSDHGGPMSRERWRRDRKPVPAFLRMGLQRTSRKMKRSLYFAVKQFCNPCVIFFHNVYFP